MALSKDMKKEEIKQKMGEALQSGNQEDFVQAYIDLAESIKQEVLEDARMYQKTADKEILQKRGVRQLTSTEHEFYQKFIEAAKSSNPKQELSNLEIGLPETVVDTVMDDIRSSHPLLEAVDFQSNTALTKILVNKQGKQLAVWGAINSAITEELAGTIGKIDLSLNKLTAFLPVAKDMLAIGEKWIDAYVRAVLQESVAFALEEGIINGSGKDMPIGMNRQVGESVTVTGGVYPKKNAVTITDLSPTTIGSLLAELSKDPVEETKARSIGEIIFIVNPFDYYIKVMPATTFMTPQGTYVNNVMPYPMKIIQSSQVPAGEAIIGIAKKYAIGVGAGAGKEGKIEYSDEYKFLEDERYYIIKLIANGRAINDNDFILLDISALKPANLKIKMDDETLKTITITSAAGTVTGKTKITTQFVLETGCSYKYKIGDNVTTPVLDQILIGWTSWDGTSEITAETGKKIVIAEVNGINQVKAVGTATVTSKEE